MSKTIGMVLDAYYPSDIRVQKEAKALIDAGFEVALLCKRRKNEIKEEEVDGIKVMRIWAGRGNFSKGIIDVLLSLLFIHPIFFFRINRFIKRFNVDVIHVHDLPLVKTLIIKMKGTGIKVVSDFHENYPEALKVWFQWKTNPIIRLKNNIFFGYNRWMKYESWAVEYSDYVIAVVDEMKIRILSEHPNASGKVVVVTNTENKSFAKSNLNEAIYEDDKDKFILAYTGGVGPHRGVDTAIKGMALIKHNADIVLYVVGSLSDAARSMLESMIIENDLQEQVHVLGYKPFDLFYSYMKMASVNVIPHNSNGHTDHTVPHKLFQCMMTGNPLLVSSSTPLKRIVEETESGLVFNAGDPIDFAKRVEELYADDELRRRLGEKGLKATLDGHYNWEASSANIVKLYSSVLS